MHKNGRAERRRRAGKKKEMFKKSREFFKTGRVRKDVRVCVCVCMCISVCVRKKKMEKIEKEGMRMDAGKENKE